MTDKDAERIESQARISRCITCKHCMMMWGDQVVCEKIPYSYKTTKRQNKTYSFFGSTVSENEYEEFVCETVPTHCNLYEIKEDKHNELPKT